MRGLASILSYSRYRVAYNRLCPRGRGVPVPPDLEHSDEEFATGLAAQLDRLTRVVGLDTVELGIIPFSASLKIPPATAFWMYDDSRVIVETWHSELWIEDEASVSTYLRTWNTLKESAVYGADAHRAISAARRTLDV